ncbi:MAG: glycosyltransferase family 87 protein [Chloroflexota bacterium]
MTTSSVIRGLKLITISGFLIGCIILLSVFTPIRINADMDFSMLYAVDQGLQHGIGFYDHNGQTQVLATEMGVKPSDLNLPRFIYPPYFALVTFYLAWFSPEQAARMWFFLSAGMIFLSNHFLLRGQSILKKSLGLILSFLALPALGGLFVGQFVAPVLLGLAIIVEGSKRESSWIFASGLVLLTIKPQLGLIPFLVVIIWLLTRKKAWSNYSIGISILGIMLLLIISWVVDPGWLGDYYRSILEFRNLPTYRVCEICSGLSVHLSRIFAGEPNTTLALFFGTSMIMGLGVIFILRKWWKLDLPNLLALAVITTMLVNPYLNNYDYLLLSLPMAIILTGRTTKKEYLLLVGSILIPWLVLISGERILVAYALSSISCFYFMWFVVCNPRLI